MGAIDVSASKELNIIMSMPNSDSNPIVCLNKLSD